MNLPWGIPITVDPREAICYNIWSHGIYEIGVTEALWRLTEPDETAVDAGANIGYTASILAVRVGIRVRVICFEPNPIVFDSLNSNVECWKKYKKCGNIVIYQAALASKNGTAVLQTSDYIKQIEARPG